MGGATGGCAKSGFGSPGTSDVGDAVFGPPFTPAGRGFSVGFGDFVGAALIGFDVAGMAFGGDSEFVVPGVNFVGDAAVA